MEKSPVPEFFEDDRVRCSGSSEGPRIVTSEASNAAKKGEIFKKAYARVKRALSADFCSEAIAICDSLITDRLRLVMATNSEISPARAGTGKIANFLGSENTCCRHHVVMQTNGGRSASY